MTKKFLKISLIFLYQLIFLSSFESHDMRMQTDWKTLREYDLKSYFQSPW